MYLNGRPSNMLMSTTYLQLWLAQTESIVLVHTVNTSKVRSDTCPLPIHCEAISSISPFSIDVGGGGGGDLWRPNGITTDEARGSSRTKQSRWGSQVAHG